MPSQDTSTGACPHCHGTLMLHILGGAVFCAGCGRAINPKAASDAAAGALRRVSLEFRQTRMQQMPQAPPTPPDDFVARYGSPQPYVDRVRARGGFRPRWHDLGMLLLTAAFIVGVVWLTMEVVMATTGAAHVGR